METLIVLAHPDIRRSRLNAALARAVRSIETVTLHDIYSVARNGGFDVAQEQKLVERHSRIIFQFPLYWYSCPPLLSEWLISVFLRGWSYGPGGRALNFKTFGVATTTGSNARDYQHDGRYRRTLEEVLVPFELLARHSGMHYLPPFCVTAAREVTDVELETYAANFCDHVLSAQPIIEFDGRDDSRAKTVYPAHYHT